MIRYLLSILIVLCASYTFAQNAKIDSLKALLPKTQGADRVDLCRELAINMFGIDKQTSFDFAKEGLRLATDIGDSARMIKVAKTVTAILRRFEKYDSAIILGNYIEKIAHRNYFNSVDHGDILNGLAMNYIYLSQYDMAISYLQNARSAFEESDDLNGLFAVLNNIGLTYYKFQNPELALVYYKRSLKLSKSINNKSYADTLSLPINISLCYMALDSLKKARSIIQPILEKCPSKCSDNEFALALSGSAVIFYHSDSLQKAEKEFLRAYAFAKKINHHRFLFDAIIYLAKIYLKRGDLTSAEQFLMEGNTLTTQNHFDLEEMKVYKELIALFRARDEIRKLPFYQAKYIQLNDSIYNETKTNNLMHLHAEDREKEYKTQLAAQERTMQLKDEIISKQL
ncbi:MAG TPA: tetratricopeptide repeat protein, partial [Ohtaekwangia sp.]